MRYFMIEETELKYLRLLKTRMHSEERLSGDEMRDIGHVLGNITRVVILVPEEEESP